MFFKIKTDLPPRDTAVGPAAVPWGHAARSALLPPRPTALSPCRQHIDRCLFLKIFSSSTLPAYLTALSPYRHGARRQMYISRNFVYLFFENQRRKNI
jgi:hypothetical protein